MSTIAAADSNILYSPYTWDVASTAKTINAGAYFKVSFTGTPATLAATFDVANMATPASRVGFRVDGGPWQDFDIAATVPLVLTAGNTWTVHTVEMVVISTTETAVRWTAPQNTAIVFTGLTADVTVATVPTRPRDLIGLLLGDSITEGVRTLNMTAPDDTDRNDSRLAWAYPLGDLLGAEVGVVGFGAVGISRAGNGGVPKFSDNAPYLYAGKSRDLLTPREPDFIVAHIGTNDSGSTDAAVTADTKALLDYWLGATTSTKVLVLAGWTQKKASPIQSGIAACAAPDRVTYVDTTGWWNTADSSDTLHPYGYINTIDLSPRLAAAIRPHLSGGTATAPAVVFRRAPDGSAIPISTAAF